MTNSLKHAQAQNIWLNLTFDENQVHLQLRDDGQGFDLQHSTNHGGFGLIGMRQRAEQLGSHIKIVSQPEQGTDISVHVIIRDQVS